MEKQIEEMLMLMTEGARPAIEDAEALYNAGYRKASDLAEEIFAEIEKMLDDVTIVMGVLDSLWTFHKTIEKVTAGVEELKKKYTESKGE